MSEDTVDGLLPDDDLQEALHEFGRSLPSRAIEIREVMTTEGLILVVGPLAAPLDLERLARSMKTVYTENLVFPVKGGGPYDWSLDAKFIAKEYAQREPAESQEEPR